MYKYKNNDLDQISKIMRNHLVNGFSEIEHTADIGIEIWADSMEKLFSNAIQGYYYLVMSDNFSLIQKDLFNFSDENLNYENLLISCLSEINYLLMVKNEVINPIISLQIDKINDQYKLMIQGRLQLLENPDRTIKTEIKAVTYHQIKIKKENGIFRTKIIFDI